VTAELFHTDGRTAHMTKLILAFRNFANASKKVLVERGKGTFLRKPQSHVNS